MNGQCKIHHAFIMDALKVNKLQNKRLIGWLNYYFLNSRY
jgi:hypothetical protein